MCSASISPRKRRVIKLSSVSSPKGAARFLVVIPDAAMGSPFKTKSSSAPQQCRLEISYRLESPISETQTPRRSSEPVADNPIGLEINPPYGPPPVWRNSLALPLASHKYFRRGLPPSQ